MHNSNLVVKERKLQSLKENEGNKGKNHHSAISERYPTFSYDPIFSKHMTDVFDRLGLLLESSSILFEKEAESSPLNGHDKKNDTLTLDRGLRKQSPQSIVGILTNL
jgi:hypothetical protein